ncbi:MAG: YebC/PmpR family DNA-binding transcriptional regulator [Patescibacteria group bacterium]
MSGHNKFSQIKHQKESEDAKRSKLFGILGKMISVQARLAKGDVNHPALRASIEKARKANMPKDNIERAIARGKGGEAGELEEVLYEAYGPGGVALVIAGITDSKNRTSNEIKNILSAHSGSLGGPGSTTWAFTKTKDSEGSPIWQANSTMPVADSDKENFGKLLNELEDHADIQSISHNAG